VEKPLFDSNLEFKIRNNEVVVGYNLRFHPLLNKVRELCQGKRLWSINMICGSYLPEWRPGRDYRMTSSARKNSGGGVHLDLSHELDFALWLDGPMEVDYAVSKKVSDLEIESEDILLFSGRTRGGTYVQMALNYFTREPIRQIIIDGEGISIQGNLITKNLVATVEGKKNKFSWSDLDPNETYRAMHLALLAGDLSKICSFEEGLQTMGLIDRICSWARK